MQAIKQHVLQKLDKMLQRVDNVPVTRQQKLKLYRVGICPRLTWDLAVNSLPLSWVTKELESLATRFLKKWSGLAKSADTSQLYLPQSRGGLSLPAVSLMYKRQQVSLSLSSLSATGLNRCYSTFRKLKRDPERREPPAGSPPSNAHSSKHTSRGSRHEQESTDEKNKGSRG